MSDRNPLDPLYNALDLPTPTREVTEVIVPEDFSGDAETARRNTHALIAATTDAVRDMGEIAWTSQSARAYEVLGQLIEKGLAANRELFELEKRKRDIQGQEQPKLIEGGQIKLTSAEMLDLVKAKK